MEYFAQREPRENGVKAKKAYWAERTPTKADTKKSVSTTAAAVNDLAGALAAGLWVGSGLMLLGVVATAVIVPISVSRSRSRKCKAAH